MSKFNKTNTMKTKNKCGAIAYAMPDKNKLVTQVLTSFYGEEKYYGDTTNDLIKTANAVLEENPEFVCNLAAYARKEMNLRSVSHALVALIAYNPKSKNLTKTAVSEVVQRADDITEILACYLSMFGKPIPNALKKALAKSFDCFNAYQFSKYNGGNKSIKFRDVLCLVHKKPKDKEQAKLLSEIMNDTLPVAERWETELSAHGNNAETWERLIDNNKLGYMAMLRNLRNIIKAKPKNINKVYEKIADKTSVINSKQLPFRFFSAYKEIAPICTNKPLDALEIAIEYSTANIPRMKGKTIIAIDTSGSMKSRVSSKSEVLCSDIARLLGVIASRVCDEYEVYTFDTTLKKVTYSTQNGIINTALNIPVNGGGTDITLPLVEMLKYKKYADRLIILSDNEINRSYTTVRFWGRNSVPCQQLADRYRKDINPNLWVHAIDLQGYGTQQFIGGKTNIIAGWSEKLLKFISLSEEGIDKQVRAIENYLNI